MTISQILLQFKYINPLSKDMTAVKFRMPVLIVKDISVSKNFYQDVLSLEIEEDFGENISFKDSISIWETKTAERIIFKSEKQFPPMKLKHLELYFETDEIEEIGKELNEKSIEIIHGLKEEPWGQRTIRFFDPDRYIIELAEPISQVILRLAKADFKDKEIAHKTQMSIKEVRKILKDFRTD
jgi:predicted enzyme related to lactoylglutathione lyase